MAIFLISDSTQPTNAMSITRFKTYTPGDKTYSRRRTDEEWAVHHQLLSDMHTQRYTRKEMLAKLGELGFEVSPGQLLAQMKKWDMMVYTDRGSLLKVTYNPSPEPVHPEALDPVILDSEEIDNPMDLLNQLGQADDLVLPPLLNEDCSLSIRRCSTAEQSDDTMGGISLSSMEDLDPLPMTDEEFCTAIRGSTPPPQYCFEEPVTILPSAAEFDTAMTDPDSVLRQLSTVTEPWCGNFPTTCCCNSLFFGAGAFEKSPALYEIILEQSSPQSLKYVMALLNLLTVSSTGGQTMDLQNHFRSSLEYYLQVCTRVENKNRLATLILHRLLKIWENFSDGEHALFTKEGVSRYTTAARYAAARSNESLLKRIFKTKPTNDWKAQHPHSAVNWHNDTERDVGCVVGFTARKPSTFPLLNFDGDVFGSIKSWCTVEDFDGDQERLAELIPTAKQIAAYMQTRWDQGLTMHTAYDLGGCSLSLIFMALGLMIALEAASSAQNLVDPEQGLAAQHTWTPGIRAFIETTASTLSLNADYADKFRKAYWLVRCDKIGHRGKMVHMGEKCTASTEWEILERNIHLYDEPRMWIERQMFSNRSNTWPQIDDLMIDDNMSVRSTSSINSFRRFQALALRLRIGTPMSRSLKTKSTRSRMSTESHLSWQLEQMLQIREDDFEPVQDGTSSPSGLNSSQQAQQDQIAFARMQAIEE